jgi:hypothetical protein
MGGNGNTIRQSLYNFTTTPTVNDDNLKGYGVGSLWTLDDNTTYVCTDATTGAAVWVKVNSLLFPNGTEGVTTTRDFQASDAGKILILFPSANITMPVNSNVLPENSNVGIFALSDSSYYERVPNEPVYPFSLGNQEAEVVILMSIEFSGQTIVSPLGSAPILDNSDGKLKTAIRYLYDKSQNAISINILSDSLAQIRTEIADTANVLRGLIPNVSSYATITNLKDSTALVRGLITTPTFSLSKNSAKDSIVTVFNGVRSAVRDSIGGGGGSLSGLTSATGANTINNVANAQEWQWNSLSSGIGLKLSSNSNDVASNGAILSVERTGTIVGAQTNYSAKFINTIANASGLNTCILATSTGTGTRRAIEIGGGNIHFSSNGTAGGNNSITFNGGGYISSNSTYGLQLKGFLNKATWIYSGTENNMINIMRGESGFAEITHSFNSASVTRSMLMFGADFTSGYRSVSTTNAVIEHNAGSLIFSSNTSAGGFATFTPNAQLTVYATNNNVGIGTTTPVATAKLEITSTTQGFLPPRMTTTQINAIASPAEGLIVYNTTLHELCFYDGTSWRKFSHSTM